MLNDITAVKGNVASAVTDMDVDVMLTNVDNAACDAGDNGEDLVSLGDEERDVAFVPIAALG